VQVADLIVMSAMMRHESRGLHFSRDYPKMLDKAVPTILRTGQAGIRAAA
jgi:L-aspartate oxidase